MSKRNISDKYYKDFSFVTINKYKQEFNSKERLIITNNLKVIKKINKKQKIMVKNALLIQDKIIILNF